MILLSQIAAILGSATVEQDCVITGFTTDSRAIKPGECFVALRGEFADGHQFIEQAVDHGAAAVLVEQTQPQKIAQLQVKDTYVALQTIARCWRERFTIPVIAITGSCGKTSTRALLQGILSVQGNTLASERSYNNHVGVPLTLLRLRPQHQYAVIEVGTNHPGEIESLIKLVQPTVSMITNAGSSHLEGFGSVKGVATEKANIYQGLMSGGKAIINADDAFASYWQQQAASYKQITFGLESDADVMARSVTFDDKVNPSFELVTPKGNVSITLNVIGPHQVYNALAAAAAAIAVGIPLQTIQQGLAGVKAETRRLVEQQGFCCATVIDDSYNANPNSVVAAIDVLKHRGGERVLVLGDMLELGKMSDECHRMVGEKASESGIERLLCYGPNSRLAAKAFGSQGMHFETQQQLVDCLRPMMRAEMTVLVKGSNSMKMNQVAELLLKG